MVVGHVTWDVVAEGRRPGGTAVYAALTAQRLGERVGVVTSAAPDFNFAAILPGIAVVSHPAPATTTFENLAGGDRRRQRLLARAADLDAADIPVLWRRAAIAHLAPLAGEVPPTLLGLFPKALTGVTAQGWLRRWDATGWISRGEWPDAARVLAQAGVTILSAEDLGGDEAAIAAYAARAKLLVVTRGTRGATVYRCGVGRDVAAFPTQAVDTTGAGDVFAATYLIALARGADPIAAARYANCAASFVVEQPGTAGIPTAAAIEERLVARHSRFERLSP